MSIRFHLLVLSLLISSSALAQQDAMKMAPSTSLSENILNHTSSGTSVEPGSAPKPMLMSQRKGWTLMLHGEGFLSEVQQHASSNRGAGKLFSTNWLMPMAQRRFGRSKLTLRTMLSLEPATITGRFYPELFQQGETANGKPIIDGQHPHDLFMELGALYDFHPNDRTLLSLYAAPVGDPALGPTAYPHRQSASEDPMAALGHHQEDSTHIAFNVLTAGLTYRTLRLEASGFHGAEPTEARWHFQPSPNGLAPDSVSGRLTWAPNNHIAAQYSVGHITSPEATNLAQNQFRQTASVMYSRPIGAHHDSTSMPGMDMATPATGTWSSTALWGQTRSLPGDLTENSFLLESLLTIQRNSVWARIEVAARTTELLIPAPAIEGPAGHVQAYTLGYGRNYRIAPHLYAAPGAQFTLDVAPDRLSSTYGRTPFSGVAFVRFRIQ
jgi:hypothetical protein